MQGESKVGLSAAALMLDANEHNSRIVKAVLCAGFYPNVVRVKNPQAKYVKTEGGTVLKEAAGHQVKLYVPHLPKSLLPACLWLYRATAGA